MKKKYSNSFEKDFIWYIRNRHNFDFDGRLDRDIIFDRSGVDGKQCFYIFDSTGVLMPTKHPRLVKVLLKTKGSINLHIKMWKEDKLSGCLFRDSFIEIVEEFLLLPWMINIIYKDCMQEIYYEIKEGFEGRPRISYHDFMEAHPYDRHKYERIYNKDATPCSNHARESDKEEEKIQYTLVGSGLNLAPLREEEEDEN